MEPLLINYVKDKVSEIREAVTLKLDALIAVYKNEWVFQRLLPKLNEYMSKDNSYLIRLSAIKGLEHIASNIQPDAALEKILPVICKHC